MISRRTEALLAIREAGGEGANILKKVDRMLSAERFRADNRAAKRLRMLAEDAVLGYYGRGG